MLTDLRVGLVYRWRSVRKKYVELNDEKILQRHTERMIKEKMRQERKYQDSLRRDSLEKVKQEIRIKKQNKYSERNEKKIMGFCHFIYGMCYPSI